MGIDVGGTFTDLVLLDSARERLFHYKEPSTPADPSIAVEKGLAALTALSGLTVSKIDTIVHGMTIGLNAILQRKGARTAFVVSTGHRDVFEIARCRLPSSFNFHVGKEAPLVPRQDVFEVGARIAADGSVLEWPEDGEVSRMAGTIRGAGYEVGAVMLINSYVNPSPELELAEKLSRETGLDFVSSSDLWPEMREYERALVAALTATITPLTRRYIDGLEERLAGSGFRGQLYIATSNGGTCTAEAARARPLDTVLSGPAAGVVAASNIANSEGFPRILTFDMGGTSSDTAVVSNAEPEYTNRTELGDFPLFLPVVNVTSIGAGGGSMVWVDDQGVPKVGPDSAGSDPGPAAYGRGGIRPTVTDAYVALGVLSPAGFLGGRMTLDGKLAEEAFRSLGASWHRDTSVASMAEGALKIASARMATELYRMMAQRGLDPREYALVAFGGAGPTHACFLAEEAGIDTIIVPEKPGTLCALGALLADIRRDYVKVLRLSLLSEASAATIARYAEGLHEEAKAWLKAQGESVDEARFLWSADLRYQGQAYELSIDLDQHLHRSVASDSIADAFHKAHEAIYGFRDSDTPIELGTLRLRAVGRVLRRPARAEGDPQAGDPANRRKVFLRGRWLEVPVVSRSSLAPVTTVSGPMIIEQDDTTVLVADEWSGTASQSGNLILKRTQNGGF